jgi:protein-tyrosine phosphatase
MTEKYDRHLRFKSITNFRDLGGYRTRGDKTFPWRRIFRSGELSRMNPDEYRRITDEIKLAAVVDLRSSFELERQGTGLPDGCSIKYFNVPFMSDGGQTTDAEARRYKTYANMGEFYVELVQNTGFGQGIVKALEIIAEPKNHPLVFNCAIGKDRTGILAATLLSLLGVAEKDIIEDYALSDQYTHELQLALESHSSVPDDVKKMPDFFWRAAPESMTLLLSTLRQDYGSIASYLQAMGADNALGARLEKAVLA